ncbi:hypothetical protein ACO0RG_004284 [Hanseniaspora osmophila]|uniref:Uncharacterized protein n=1 Tax=Hanseniaspora osmophila TaxID=56408 RepID=A0A1E5RAP7_9ASCO|nr:hypothetical protein AWRI3579_g2909 [Hanseniaspora osmophila]
MLTKTALPKLAKSSYISASSLMRSSCASVQNTRMYSPNSQTNPTDELAQKEKGEEKYYVSKREKEFLTKLNKYKEAHGGDLHKALEALSKEGKK